MRKNEAQAARPVPYYNEENALRLLENPQFSPYVYNRQSLGLRLDTAEEIGVYRHEEKPHSKKIKNFSDYARALISAVMQVQENQHLHSDDWQRTIYINTLDVKTTDFDISDEKKKALIQQGITGAENYFRWFEDPAEKPVNRIALHR